jgi:FtsZ-interacting cell division protein ZipA
MYYADSDLLSILLAIITLAAGFYSSSKKSRKSVDSVAPNPDMSQHEDMSISDIFQEDDFFQEIASMMDDAEPDQDSDQDQAQVQEAEPLQEEAVPQTVVSGSGKSETEESVKEPESVCEEQKQNSLKERLKGSPKDAILFSEILKPKYKEF